MTDVELRPAGEDDRAFVTELAGDPRIAATLAPLTHEELPQALERGDVLVALVAGERVGALRVTMVSERSKVASLHTVMVDPDRQGQGLGVAMVRAAVVRCFGERGLHRVQAEAYGFNAAAIRTFEKAGFAREGTRRRAWWRDGAYHDGALLGVLSD